MSQVSKNASTARKRRKNSKMPSTNAAFNAGIKKASAAAKKKKK